MKRSTAILVGALILSLLALPAKADENPPPTQISIEWWYGHLEEFWKTVQTLIVAKEETNEETSRPSSEPTTTDTPTDDHDEMGGSIVPIG